MRDCCGVYLFNVLFVVGVVCLGVRFDCVCVVCVEYVLFFVSVWNWLLIEVVKWVCCLLCLNAVL